ncbi:MAG: thioesterase family protein [Desulfobacterales bacterium]|nr:thioesterase family protein [Desulfobacterales bacterium]
MSAHTDTNCAVLDRENGCRVSLEQVEALPVYHRETIPEQYLDAMGHMNVHWYMALYDQATWHFFETIGMTLDYHRNYHAGAFALRQFLNYFSEIHAGQTVAVRTRLLGRTDKRFHFMHFLVNETTGRLASNFESLGTHADLKQRRSAPFPAFIAEAIDIQLDRDNRLDWEAPVCGILNL